MNAVEYLAPFLGAVALEAVHWFELRERLHHAKYQRLVRSLSYWIPTLAMALVGGAVAIIWGISQDPTASPLELLVAGAAAPTLIKKLVGAFVSKQSTMLGTEDDKVSARDYFAPR